MKHWLNLGWAVVALVVGMAPGAAAVDTQALEALERARKLTELAPEQLKSLFDNFRVHVPAVDADDPTDVAVAERVLQH